MKGGASFMHRFPLRLLAALVLLLPVTALAGSFKVVPIRLYLDARSKTTIVKVTNDGAEKVTVQLEAKVWGQGPDGRDVYTDTKDIVFFPKIADIEKGEERIIRVGYKGKPSGNERTYRLFIQELPVTKPGEVALKFALRFAVPVFVAATNEVRERSIESAELKDGRVHVKVKNGGNTHFIVSKVRATGLNGSGKEVFNSETGGWYVLSGITKTYSVDVPEAECMKASAIKVGIEVERVLMDSELSVDKRGCKRAEKTEKPAGK
jgi:fimbrial chaperone protein